jgi:hypothetical protein
MLISLEILPKFSSSSDFIFLRRGITRFIYCCRSRYRGCDQSCRYGRWRALCKCFLRHQTSGSSCRKRVTPHESGFERILHF